MPFMESRWMNLLWKVQQRGLRRLGLKRYARGHAPIIINYLSEVLKQFPAPVVFETGCIRDLNEGTESTLTIASVLQGRGSFYSFEYEPEHIRICRELCKDYNDAIHYVEGDSVTRLKEMVGSGTLTTIHFAFFDSVNDPEHVFNEFKIVEALFPTGAVLMVDDVLWERKGEKIRPYLEQSEQWEVRIHNVENGILAARKIK